MIPLCNHRAAKKADWMNFFMSCWVGSSRLPICTGDTGGASLEGLHCPVASCDALHCLTKILQNWSGVK